MTHPLAAFGKVVETGRDLAENDFMVAMDVRGQSFRSALAALPVATDEGAVEELARHYYMIWREQERKGGRSMPPWSQLHGTKRESWMVLARAVLTELLAGGNDGGK